MSDEGRRWRIILQRQPEKILRRLPKDLRERVRLALWSLADDPFRSGHKKLVGVPNLYRIRVGDWHIIYSVENEQLIVLVVRIAPRGEAYGNL